MNPGYNPGKWVGMLRIIYLLSFASDWSKKRLKTLVIFTSNRADLFFKMNSSYALEMYNVAKLDSCNSFLFFGKIPFFNLYSSIIFLTLFAR